MSRILLAASAVMVFAGLAAPVFADDDEVRSQVVTYGDLNLKDHDDADELIDRIDNAADNVCGDRSGPRIIEERAAVGDCADAATEEAVQEVGHPVLLGEYYGHQPEVVIVADNEEAKKN